MDDKQLDRFKQAVDDKNEAARSTDPGGASPGDGQREQPELHEQSRPQDTRDERAKSSGHGKKTADKWNQ